MVIKLRRDHSPFVASAVRDISLDGACVPGCLRKANRGHPGTLSASGSTEPQIFSNFYSQGRILQGTRRGKRLSSPVRDAGRMPAVVCTHRPWASTFTHSPLTRRHARPRPMCCHPGPGLTLYGIVESP